MDFRELAPHTIEYLNVVADFRSRNPLEKNKEVQLVEEDIESAMFRILAETLIEKERIDEFCKFAVEALGRNVGHSTASALIDVVDDILAAKDIDKEQS
ncbi:hypothetical protein EVAR_18175_1 [Eumeta japonica]|uniref:Uncharacterized protein n=1 Tax=Eumeta variegata TaxID=151549 RepID=A0A4C1UWI3_EUMVA|nr:hypothetical protein EVAR_18175_1 [Eumeta japonica]